MSNCNVVYNPFPPRAWSRVQNPCTYIVPNDNYSEVYIPLTGQTVSQGQADYEYKLLYKGNILQYKGNSARLTKKERYSQLARCAGPSRRKVSATQSETYSNPNIFGLLRVGYTTYNYPNQIIGAPNNISGPFQYNVPNPEICLGNEVQDGGTMVCGSYYNGCTGNVIEKSPTPATICNPASASNVPGPGFLCWNTRMQTYFPKPRYFMNNSTDKWPYNYKGFVSAVQLKPPTASLMNLGNSIEVSWVNYKNAYVPISSYEVYLNGNLYTTKDHSTNFVSISKDDLKFKIMDTNTNTNTKAFSNDLPSDGMNYISVVAVSNRLRSEKTTISYMHEKTNTNTTDLECSCSFFNNIMKNSSIVSVNTLLTICNQNITDLQNTDELLDLETYRTLKTSLTEYKNTLNSKCCFASVVDTYIDVLMLIYKSSDIKNKLLREILKSNSYQTSNNILNDPVQLQQYITQLNKEVGVAKVKVQTIAVNLKPKYEIYRSLYDLPDDMVFDSEKMNSILQAINQYDSLYGKPENNAYDINIITEFLNGTT